MLQKLNTLVKQFKNGHAKAFDEIYALTSKSVYFSAYNILHDKELSEDIVSETFITFVKNIDKFDESKNLTNWLYTIAKNKAINKYNVLKREVSFSNDVLESLAGGRHEEGEWLIDYASKVLSKDEFIIISLCEIKGYKRREVADMLLMPISTVTFKYNEALKKLRTKLEKGGLV